MTPPTPGRTHTWDGTRTLPDWLTGHHHWNDGQLVIHHRDDTTHIQTGWMIVEWSDGAFTAASPRVADRVYGPDGVVGRLAAAEAELRRYTEADSADAAAGSYALRAERVEAQLAAAADLIADHEGDDWAAHPATSTLRSILNDDQAPAASCSPAAPETEPNNPERTTANNPTTWTPPPPGDRREQLPDHLLALLDIPPYTSTACETAELLAAAVARNPERSYELRYWEDRQRQRCRINNKYTGVICQHATNADPSDLTGYLAPDPPIGCLTVTAGPDAECKPEAATLNSTAPNASRVESVDPWTEGGRLAQSGVDTPGCDCGHDGMGIGWHGDDCPWRRSVLEGASPEPTLPQHPGHREQLHAAIESEMYEYRERTMWWPETGGVTEEIARLATRGAMEVRDRELETLQATLAAITAEAARRGVISIDGIRKITGAEPYPPIGLTIEEQP